jgi:thioredoxin 1
MPIVELTKENFEQVVTGNNTVFIDFWASWCGPCKSFAPTFESVAEQNPGVVFAKVNTEEEQEIAGYFNIRSIPTLMVFREKVIVFAQAGALPKSALEQVVQKTLELDMVKVHAEIAAQGQQPAASA